MILYPAAGAAMDEGSPMGEVKRKLHDFGLDLEVVTRPPKGALTGASVGEAERRGNGAFFIVQIDRAHGQQIAHPGRT
jgi:trk system potassium uptake protein TrkA/voltage-gated potassium channel